MWCWKRLLRVPWTAKRSNHSILKELNLEYSLEGLMLKLKLQYFGHLMGRTNSLENTLMLRGIEHKRRKGWQRMRWLDSITNSWRRKWQPTPIFLPGKYHGQRSLVGYSPWGCKESDMTERLHFTSLHQLNGDEFEQILEDSEEQGRLVWCSP